jgi:sporulation protein YlmC with PRC-barrel domain
MARRDSYLSARNRLSHKPLIFMKILLIRGATTIFLGLAVASMSAQTQNTASSSTSYIETSKFIGKKVRSAQGDEIGTVKDIVLDRNTGCLAYTVVSTTGGGGAPVSGGGKMVAVPWAVYSPSSDLNVFTVTVDRDRIYNAPVFDYARIEEYSRPEYTTNVYSYYGVSSGSAVGVGVSGSTTTGTGATTTTGTATTTGSATGTGRLGASATPAGAQASPAPRGTPAATPRSTPSRTHPTASPSSRGRETATPPSRKTRGATDTGSRSETERSQPEGSHQSESDTGTRESRPDPGQSDADQSSSAERTTGTHHREKPGKRETSSPPPERPEGQ